MSDPTFEPYNSNLDPGRATFVDVPPSFPCAACQARGGRMPRVDPSDCPVCLGGDEIGEPYCGECGYCCGC